jgi:hypothetical protein
MIIDPYKRDALWKLYFISGGFICLIYWNAIINLAEYFSATISRNGFNLMIFSFCFGSIVSFFTGPIVFARLSHKAALNFGIISSVMFFFLTLYTCECTGDAALNQSLTVGASFIFGYFSSFVQSKITGMASEISNQELVYFNFGTGVAGVSSNMFAYFATRIYPVQNDESDLSMLRQQVLLNVAIITILFVAYFTMQYFFDKQNPEVLLFEGDREIENILAETSMIDTEKSAGEITIIRKSIDILLSLTFLYVCTIVVFALFNIQAYFNFDRNQTAYTIPMYSFFFNVFDTIGKFLPSQFLIKSNPLIQSLNAFRSIIPVYFYFILHYSPTPELTSSFLRILANIVLGFSNGYFSNSLLTMATDRFSRSLEKGKAAYFSIVFLYLGIVSGAFINVLLP